MPSFNCTNSTRQNTGPYTDSNLTEWIINEATTNMSASDGRKSIGRIRPSLAILFPKKPRGSNATFPHTQQRRWKRHVTGRTPRNRMFGSIGVPGNNWSFQFLSSERLYLFSKGKICDLKWNCANAKHPRFKMNQNVEQYFTEVAENIRAYFNMNSLHYSIEYRYWSSVPPRVSSNAKNKLTKVEYKVKSMTGYVKNQNPVKESSQIQLQQLWDWWEPHQSLFSERLISWNKATVQGRWKTRS